MVDVPTRTEFDDLLKKVQVLEFKLAEFEKSIQLMRDLIDTAYAAVHPA